MLTLKEKISFLEKTLLDIKDNYAESFKNDIYIFFDTFDTENPLFHFLDIMKTKEDIVQWVQVLTSKIVIKYAPESETLSDFINEYITPKKKTNETQIHSAARV